MLVREEVVRETEQRAAREGVGEEAAAVGEGLEIDLGDAAMEPELVNIFGGERGIRKIVLPRSRVRPVRRRRPSPEAVRNRLHHAAFAGALPSKAEMERFIGENDLVDGNYFERGLAAAQPVCRLVLTDRRTGRPAYATGFMISPRLLLTNWHVFEDKGAATGAVAEFDYRLDIRGGEITPTRFDLQPEQFFLSDKGLDFALLAVAPQAQGPGKALADFGYHRLIAERDKLVEGEPITIIQHPSGGRRQVALRENQLVKEPAPQDLFLLYRSDTAKGSSGAACFNDSWQIVALHHSGKARKEDGFYVLRNGQRVASLEGIEESLVEWVYNEGIRASVLYEALRNGVADPAFRDELLAAMEGDGDIMSRTMGSPTLAPATSAARSDRPETLRAGAIAGGSGGVFPGVTTLELKAAQINLAHQIVVQAPPADAPLLRATAPAVIVPPASDEGLLEKYVQPIVDRKYGSRKGFNEDFLGLKTALPDITIKKLVTRMDNDSPFLPYQHFSVVMNKKRRLALYTASNVDASEKVRVPEPMPKGAYTRKGLGGLAKNDREQWFTDPRIPEEHQLPDVFFTKDRQAFDKGHLVRRDDVCWGRSYAMVRRANGDTYHTTNCSPQVADFNQGNNKAKNWGALEDVILRQAASEKLCLFTGPVFEDDDDVFEGTDLLGDVSIQIPRRYWKVVLANAGGTLEAFAFILKQDLSQVAFEQEFVVEAGWEKKMIKLRDLQDLLTGMRFSADIMAADQYGRDPGDEIASGVGVEKL